MQSRLPASLQLDVAATVARGTSAARTSPWTTSRGPNLKLALRRSLTERGYAQLRVALFAEDHRPGPTEIVVPSYQTFDLGGGYRLSRHIELRALVRNLFDRRYP